MIADCSETSLRGERVTSGECVTERVTLECGTGERVTERVTSGECPGKAGQGCRRFQDCGNGFRISITAGNTETYAGGCTKGLVLQVVVVTRRLVLPAHYIALLVNWRSAARSGRLLVGFCGNGKSHA